MLHLPIRRIPFVVPVFVIALLISSAVLSTRASAQNAAPLDAFLCYNVKTTKGFHPINGVSVVDRYNDLRYDAFALSELCTPAARSCNCTGECSFDGTFDRATHLNRYEIRPSDHKAKDFRPDHVSVTTCLGTVVVDLREGEKLMVPAAKSLTSQPPDPSPMGPEVDHFHCYDLDLSDHAKLPTGLTVTLSDQFTAQPKKFDVTKADHLCVAANKNGEGVKHEDAALLCYEIKAAKKQPKFKAVKKIYTTDQLLSVRMDTTSEDEVCLPADIAGDEPVCAPGPCEGGGDCTTGFCQDGTCQPLCAGGTCVCGGDCTTGFCQDSVCQQVCAPGSCSCGGDCTTGFCQGGVCQRVCAGGTCSCGGDCTTDFCQNGTCQPVCAGGACTCGGDCSTGFCDGGVCQQGFPGSPCTCGGDCIGGFCDDSSGPGVCVGIIN